MQIVTGYTGESHITSNADQGRNQGIFGSGSYVLNIGSVFAITTVSANQYQIADGEAVHQGVHWRVAPGTYDTITIDNGSQGMYRKDLIVARYTKNSSTGIEAISWVVIKGTESSTSASTPSYNTGNILSGSRTVDMPMYLISLNGINVSSVTAMFTTLVTNASIQSRLTSAESSVASHTNKLTTISGSWTRSANTVTGLTIERWQNTQIPYLMYLKISGTTTGLLSTSSGYANLWGISSVTDLMSVDIITNENLTAGYTGQVRLNKSSNVLQIGYTVDASGSSVDIPAGTSIRYERMYLLK